MNASAAGNDLYGELVVEHKRAPRNFGALDSPTHQARGHNPQCGDDLEVQLQVEDGRLRDIRSHGQGHAEDAQHHVPRTGDVVPLPRPRREDRTATPRNTDVFHRSHLGVHAASCTSHTSALGGVRFRVQLPTACRAALALIPFEV